MKTRKIMKKAPIILLGSLLAVSLSAAVSFAQTEKLVVQDSQGTTVFSVDDTGKVFSASPSTTFTQGTTAAADDYTFSNQEAYSDTNWKGGFYVAKRARGTSAAPAAVQLNDTVFTFDAQAWDGTGWARGGQIMGKVDGTPAAGKVPFYWTFRTMGNDGVMGDRMTINADGNITMPDLAGSYSNGSAYVCVNNSGMLYASESACP